MRKWRVGGLLGLLIVIGVMGACNKEELIPPDIKRYDSILFKEDYEISEGEGSLEEPIPHDEIAYLYGDMYHTKNETYKAEFGVEVDKVYRGEAALYRLSKDDMERKLKKGYEWILVMLEVYNFAEEDEQKLYFNRGEFSLYTTKGKRVKVESIERDDLPERVMVYVGESKRVVIASQVKKDAKTEDFYVGIDKLVEEYKVDLEDEIEKEDTEEEDKDEKESLIKYISLEGVSVTEDFFEEEEIEEDDKVEIEIVE